MNGEKKAAKTEMGKTTKAIPVEWIPGKHTLIVKSLSSGGKTLYARFKADKEFAGEDVRFSLSPKRGKCIYDVLNGKNVSRLYLSDSGKYALIGITNTSDGKTNANTYVYRVADKEIVYTFYGNTISNLQWIPGKDALSFLISEGNGRSLLAYDIEKQQQTCLVREDREISNYTWSPDRTYLIYSKNESYAEPQWELRKLAAIEDRQAYFRNRSYLYKYDFATGMHTRLTWGNLATSLMDISHDGKQLLFSTSRPDYSEYPYDKQSIHLLDMESQRIDTLW